MNSEPIRFAQPDVDDGRIRWLHLRRNVLLAKPTHSEAEEAELAQLAQDLGPLPFDSDDEIAKLRRELEHALARGYDARADELEAEIARRQRSAERRRQAAAAKEKLRPQFEAEQAARLAEAEARAQQQAADAAASEAVAGELAAALVALHRIGATVPQRLPTMQPAHVWRRAVQIAAQQVNHGAPNFAGALIDSLHLAAI
jgi:hypothetical protein